MADRVTIVPVLSGWSGGREVRYVDLGPVSTAIGDAYVPIHGIDAEGNPLPVQGQHVIFDCQPDEPHYSPIWLVHYAVVGKDYQANGIRSEDQILRGGYPVVKSRLTVNCPLFAGVRVQGADIPAKAGWCEGKRLWYLDFGQTTIHPANVYQFAYCRLPGGLWSWVREQAPVFDSLPGDPNYSSLRRINLVMTTSSYRSNAIRDIESIYRYHLSVQPTAEIRNMPLLPQSP